MRMLSITYLRFRILDALQQLLTYHLRRSRIIRLLQSLFHPQPRGAQQTRKFREQEILRLLKLRLSGNCMTEPADFRNTTSLNELDAALFCMFLVRFVGDAEDLECLALDLFGVCTL